jgi:hypothetical protein
MDDILEATLHYFHQDQCLRVSTSNKMDAQRFLGELVVGKALDPFDNFAFCHRKGFFFLKDSRYFFLATIT